MEKIYAVKNRGKRKILEPISAGEAAQNLFKSFSGGVIDSQFELISMLLPPAVKAFFEELNAEVGKICGARHQRGTPGSRWGSQPGSIVMGNQKISIHKQRVRDPKTGQEIPLTTYARFQDSALFDQHVFQEGLKHVSQRDYEKGLPKIAASFGVSKSKVSRSWIRTTTQQVEKLLTRDLGLLKITAVLIDGKRFSKLGVVVALGISENGTKHVLGIYQSSTENSAACRELLDDLERRGLPLSNLLFVVDGGSGLNKALNEKYQLDDPKNRRAVRARCWSHKWRNIEAVLDEQGQAEVAPLYWATRDARDSLTAKNCSDALETALRRHNVSALNSYLQAKEDLLVIHQLGLSSRLKKFFSTTNPIESLNSLLEEDLRRVKRWRDSEHFQRWLATACLQNEKRMRKIRGFQGLPALVVRLQELCATNENLDNEGDVA